MSEQDNMNHKDDAARLKSRNRAVGLALGGLVLFLFIVSWAKIEKAEPTLPVDQSAAGISE